MRKTQRFIFDTRLDVEFEEEWDNENPDAPKTPLFCVLRDGTKITDPTVVNEMYSKSLELCIYKNKQLVPALLAALPSDEKQTLTDEEGNPYETFKTPPKFFEISGKIDCDLSHIKLKATRDTIRQIVDTKNTEYEAAKSKG